MIAWTRRRFTAGAALSSIAFSASATRGQAKPRIVIVGGGIGGATVARYLGISLAAVDITIVEPKSRYTACVFGNLYLAGMRSLESLTYTYETLSSRYGVKLVHDIAASIDPVARRVRLASGAALPYDRLVVSPGIAFVPGAIEGYDAAAGDIMPNAWLAGDQAKQLHMQLDAMPNGGLFIITVPRDLMRCPLGPYERASLAAYYFKQFKPRSKVIILDSKESFPERELFENGWNRHYPGMIEWLPATSAGAIKAVDVKTRSVMTTTQTFKANVVNVIPPQIAGDISRASGLADRSGWCAVDPFTFESKRQPAIHVIGDAADAGEMPKSAFSANSQAKACAFSIAAVLTGRDRPTPHLLDASFTFLAGDDAVRGETSFAHSRGSIKATDMAMSGIRDTKERRRRTVQQAHGWYDAFMRDVFG